MPTFEGERECPVEELNQILVDYGVVDRTLRLELLGILKQKGVGTEQLTGVCAALHAQEPKPAFLSRAIANAIRSDSLKACSTWLASGKNAPRRVVLDEDADTLRRRREEWAKIPEEEKIVPPDELEAYRAKWARRSGRLK